jgi:hypothetical protein
LRQWLVPAAILLMAAITDTNEAHTPPNKTTLTARFLNELERTRNKAIIRQRGRTDRVTEPDRVLLSAPRGFSRSASGVELLFFDHEDDAQPASVITFDPTVNRTYHYES